MSVDRCSLARRILIDEVTELVTVVNQVIKTTKHYFTTVKTLTTAAPAFLRYSVLHTLSYFKITKNAPFKCHRRHRRCKDWLRNESRRRYGTSYTTHFLREPKEAISVEVTLEDMVLIYIMTNKAIATFKLTFEPQSSHFVIDKSEGAMV